MQADPKSIVQPWRKRGQTDLIFFWKMASRDLKLYEWGPLTHPRRDIGVPSPATGLSHETTKRHAILFSAPFRSQTL